MNTERPPTQALQDHWTFLLLVACLALLLCGGAYGQKGMGDPTGIVRQGLNPPLTTLSGKLVSIETHPCENTTGYALAGTHLIVEAEDGTKYNIHVGPADAVASIVEPLTAGARIEVQAFRTATMPQDQYVATRLVLAADRVVELRDASLRPFWAGQGGFGRGANQRWTGRGQAWTGRGQAWGRRGSYRWQAAPNWSGPQFRGGWRGRGRGR